MNLRFHTLTSVTVIFCVLVTGCTETSIETTPPIQDKDIFANSRWRMVAYYDYFEKRIPIHFTERKRGGGFYSLAFLNGDTLVGFDNCNGYSGPYKAFSNKAIEVGNIFSTLVYCPNNVDMLGALRTAHHFVLQDTSLFINTNTASIKKMEFIRD